LVVYLGWPAAFALVGILGYLWLAVWWFVYFTPARVVSENQAPPASWRKLVRTRFLISFTLSKVFVDPVWYFYIFWFPKYLASEHGLDLAQIGMTAWIPFLTADLGNLVGGWFTGRLIRRGVAIPVARKTSATVAALMMTAAIPAAFATDVALAVGLVSIATFGYTSYSANTLAFPADVFPRNTVGSIWGLASMGSGFGGMAFSWLSGRVIDHYGYLPVFVGYGVMPLVALGIILFLLGPLRPDPRFQE
jgi:ACS family hexuronate transporter-like MFS transporter